MSVLPEARSPKPEAPSNHDAPFRALGLSERTLAALDRAGFEAPTPIQARAIPPALEGRDVIGCAATGTGKTAAFLLPILERLAANPKVAGKRGPRALVLAPTRELALQIGDEAKRFGGDAVRSATVIGGVGMNPQADAFRAGVEIIVATPGRLCDHLDRQSAVLEAVEVLVLDEADRMLDMGFRPQLDRILARLRGPRQTMLFSATMAGEVAEFAAKYLREPARVEVARSGTTAQRATQQVFLVPHDEKLALLCALLSADEQSTLVFTRTKRRADRVAKGLDAAGFNVAVIHADRSQAQRRHALEGFKDGTYRILVATDIAARGIDVAEIGHVINFDLPDVPEDYVHRIGRTARAAASGRASSFASPEEQEQLQAIEKLTRAAVPRAPVPRGDLAFSQAMQHGPKFKPPGTRQPDARPANRRGGRKPQPHDSQREHARPARQQHAKPAQHAHPKPAQQGHGKPAQQGHAKSAQQGHAQAKHGQPQHGQPQQRPQGGGDAPARGAGGKRFAGGRWSPRGTRGRR